MTIQTAPGGVTHEAWRDFRDQGPLRKWRKAEGLSLKFVSSEVLNVSMTMIQLYERGVHPVPENKYPALADAMGVSEATVRRRFSAWSKLDPRGA